MLKLYLFYFCPQTTLKFCLPGKVDMRNKKSLVLKITENMVMPLAILFLPFV